MKHVQRAQIILPSAARLPGMEIAKRVSIIRPMVWQQRFAEQGLGTVCFATRSARGILPAPQAKVHACSSSLHAGVVAEGNDGSLTRRAHALFQMTIYAARARHSANAAERLCL